MPDPETTTGSDPQASAQNWVAQWLRSDVTSAPDAPGGPALPFDPDAPSTGGNKADATVAPVMFAGYEILGRIGRGGMGTVFRARDPELDRVVALKVISGKDADDTAARTRFDRESKALAALKHPNVVTVYRAGTWQGSPYFTMEYVPGGALNKRVGRFRGDPAAAARLVAKVARAVQALHDAGVLHRDLKPHNILLGPGDEPLVADFGLVKKLGDDSDASVTGAPMGTRQYMSPEQTYGQKANYTPACDIWAVGVVLYELLAGARPFPSLNPIDVYLEVRAANPVPLRDHDPAVPADLAAVVAKCLRKNPADRYPTAAAVAADLEAWLAGDAVTAPAPPAPPRPPRPRWLVPLAAGVLAAVAAGAVTVALTGPPPDPDQTPAVEVAPMPRELSPEELVARGRPVEFIPAAGGPRYPFRYLPGSRRIGAAMDGDQFVLESTDGLGVELLTHPLVPGTRFEAEMRIRGIPEDHSRVGVFVGGAEWATPDGPRTATVQLTRSAPIRPQGPVLVTALELQWWADRGTVDRLAFPRNEEPVGPGRTAGWHHLAAVVWADRVEAAWDGLPASPVTAADLTRRLRDLAPAAAPPPFGPRLGLVVHHAAAAYRNVRVVPPVIPPR